MTASGRIFKGSRCHNSCSGFFDKSGSCGKECLMIEEPVVDFEVMDIPRLSNEQLLETFNTVNNYILLRFRGFSPRALMDTSFMRLYRLLLSMKGEMVLRGLMSVLKSPPPELIPDHRLRHRLKPGGSKRKLKKKESAKKESKKKRGNRSGLKRV